VNNSHWKVKYTVKQKPVLLLPFFHFIVSRHVSESIRIYKIDTDIDKMVHSVNVLCIHCIKEPQDSTFEKTPMNN